MPGPRLPVTVLEGRGKKHLSEAEKAERLAGEVLVLATDRVPPPNWLKLKKHQEAFAELEEQLREANIFAALDADTLGRYVLLHEQWVKASGQLKKVMSSREMDLELVDQWSRLQERFFKQARACATDLGLTITSRCRLVVPQGIPTSQENPFEKMKREREERSRNA